MLSDDILKNIISNPLTKTKHDKICFTEEKGKEESYILCFDTLKEDKNIPVVICDGDPQQPNGYKFISSSDKNAIEERKRIFKKFSYDTKVLGISNTSFNVLKKDFNDFASFVLEESKKEFLEKETQYKNFELNKICIGTYVKLNENSWFNQEFFEYYNKKLLHLYFLRIKFQLFYLILYLQLFFC